MRMSADSLVGEANAAAEEVDDDNDDMVGKSSTSSSSSSSISANKVKVNDFEGVQVKVSFSAGGEVFLMSQLSGGQKALVALAIIFAIQRCDVSSTNE